MPATTLRRIGAVVTLTAAAVLTAAQAASAHVTVHPDSYPKGAIDGVLTFRVPDEEDAAATTKVQVFLPTDHPLLGVLVSPHDGWTAKVTNTKLRTPVKTDDGTVSEAVSEITWTGGRIGAGQYADFDVAFGQLPDDTGQLTFKALQTYSDGKVVRWIEAAVPGDEDPENPAPVVKLTAKAETAVAKASSSKSSSDSDSTARRLGGAGLAVGVLGLATGVFGVLRGRRAE